MNKNKFLITRLEESKILRKINYQISASNKNDALAKLKKAKYECREIGDEVQEEDWKPKKVLSISKF